MLAGHFGLRLVTSHRTLVGGGDGGGTACRVEDNVLGTFSHILMFAEY